MCIFALSKDKGMMKRLLLLWIAIGFAVMTFAAKKQFTLVIDAGHGGHDAGAVGAITKEKIINLNVALAFGRLVEQNCPDVKVVYTRKTDVFIPLHTRADIANKRKADLFISIHTNALPKGRISRGLETYTLGMHRAGDNLDVAKRENSVILIEKDYKQRYQGFDPNSSESYIMFEFIQDHNMAQSVELAKMVQRRTCSIASRQNKGVKQAGFLVLRETSMPSCLIELGFISTPDEERFLNSVDGVALLGRGIYQAFVDYKRKYDRGITVPYKAEPQQEVNIPSIVPQNEQEPEKPKRKSKAAQELADVREGKLPTEQEPIAPAVDADSIVTATPENTEPVAETAPTPQKPIQQETKVAQSSAPVFKLQILASSTKLKTTDARLKGHKEAEYYEEGGLFKYTLGASENYNEIVQLRKSQLTNFPQAFIIAFKEGKKMNVQDAIREFKSRK